MMYNRCMPTYMQVTSNTYIVFMALAADPTFPGCFVSAKMNVVTIFSGSLNDDCGCIFVAAEEEIISIEEDFKRVMFVERRMDIILV